MPSLAETLTTDIVALQRDLAATDYIGDAATATIIYLGQGLEQPVLVEGFPGVGKTGLARACSRVFGLPLIRLQCYEGLDETKALSIPGPIGFRSVACLF